MIGPKFVQLAGELGDSVVMVKCDVDANAEAAEKAGISCMPTFQFYKGGAKIHEIQGADFNSLQAKINELK